MKNSSLLETINPSSHGQTVLCILFKYAAESWLHKTFKRICWKVLGWRGKTLSGKCEFSNRFYFYFYFGGKTPEAALLCHYSPGMEIAGISRAFRAQPENCGFWEPISVHHLLLSLQEMKKWLRWQSWMLALHFAVSKRLWRLLLSPHLTPHSNLTSTTQHKTCFT